MYKVGYKLDANKWGKSNGETPKQKTISFSLLPFLNHESPPEPLCSYLPLYSH